MTRPALKTLSAWFFLFVAICPGSRVLAADPERGRLSDGRAYRTDQQGNQLVDYIAELELSVDSLNRRVMGLEDEVIAKQQIVDRLKAGKDPESRLEERDLAPAGKGENDSFAYSNSKGCDDQAVAALENLKVELVSERKVCDERTARLRSEVQGLEAQLSSQANASRNARGGEGSLEQRLREDYEKAASELRVARAEMRAQREALEAEIRAGKEKLEAVEATSQVRAERIENLETDYRKVRAEADVLRRDSTARSRMASLTESSPELRTRLEGRPSQSQEASPARQRALDAVKGSINTELNQIGTLIQKRDNLVSQHGTRTAALSFKPSRAVSSTGLTTDQIRARIESAASIRELSYLRQETLQIKNGIQEDIALIGRMFKSR